MKFLLAMIAATLAIAPAIESQTPHIHASQLDRIVRAQVDSGFSGVVLVAVGDSVVFRRAYSRGPDRLTPTSRFWIASVTKSFTAATVLALQKKGLLSLGDSLNRFFPGVPADKRSITIHQLLTHTAGFTQSYVASDSVRQAATVQAILGVPLEYAPGHGYKYGDDDYQLLAAIVEQVTRRPWHEAVKREVLVPARLKNTRFFSNTADYGHRGANGMSSTADDLLLWAKLLKKGSVGRADVASIERPQVLVRKEGNLDVHYGYGARIYTSGGQIVEVMHSGSGDEGHTAIVRRLASGVTVIVLSNAGQHAGTTWSSYVAGRLVPRPH